MEVVVFLDKSQAMLSGCDEYGLLFVDVPMDRLSQRQRETLVAMMSSVIWHDYGYGHRRLETSHGVDYYQEFSPCVHFSGVAGVVDAIDVALLDYQQRVHQEKVRAWADAAEKAESEAKELAEARKWSRRFCRDKDQHSESQLVRRHPYSMETQLKCPLCDKKIGVEEIYLTSMAKRLTESVQKSIKELSMDLRYERLVCHYDAHLVKCKLRLAQKAQQEGELQALFVTSANEEQVRRFEAGFVGSVEIRQTVVEYIFRPLWGVAGEIEDFTQYGSIEEVSEARRIVFEDVAHEEYCEGSGDKDLKCWVAKAQYLTAEQYRFFCLVRAAYRGPAGFEAKQEARFVCCDCNQCERYLVGFHVLVTLTSPRGQEFSRRFEPADPKLARFINAAVFNGHWKA